MRRLRVVRDRFPVEIAVVPAEFKHRVIIVPDARAAFLKHFLALGHGTAERGKVVHLHTAVLREQPRSRLLRKDITAARVVQHDALGDRIAQYTNLDRHFTTPFVNKRYGVI